MTSEEDLAKIHYIASDADPALFAELIADGALFNADTTGRILHVSRARGPADLAVRETIRQEATLETPTQPAHSHAPVEDIQTL